MTSQPGDDRFVDLEIAASGNVQFWAVNLSCTIGTGTQLSSPVVTFGADWGGVNDFTRFPATDAATYAGSTFAITISRVGANNPPIGSNGISSTTTLLNVRFQVNNLTANASVPVTCRIMEFLSRDGVVLVRGRQSTTTPLQILTGYTLTGTALLQGARIHTGINVSCDLEGATPPIVTTTASTGTFTFGGASSALRAFGVYICTFTAAQSSFLETTARVNLQTPTYRLLPVVLRSGDIGPVDDVINITDAAIITGNWNGVVPAFTAGDLNGDARTNQNDLAILTGNVGLAGPLDSSHVVIGSATDFAAAFPNSKLRWNEVLDGVLSSASTNFGTSRTRDFWPDVSPDGTKIAFIGLDTRGDHALYVRDVVTNRDTRITPVSFAQEAFAPSWSPDGSKIAFICSTNVPFTAGYRLDQGDLCVVNATDVSGTSIRTLATDTKVQKPAWYSSDILMYACGDALCAYGFTGGRSIVALTPPADTVFDMPSVGTSGGLNFLFYRHFGTGTASLRWREITALAITASGQTTTFAGEQQVSAGGQTNDVDFFAISPTLDILFYTLNNDAFRLVDNTAGAGAPTFAAPVLYFQAGFVGNPTWTDFEHPASGDFLTESDLFPYRATFDWVP